MDQTEEAVVYLFNAIEKDDYNCVYSLVESRKVDPNSVLTRIVTQKETQDYTALYLAASLGRARICRYLLSKGADAFYRMVFGMYPIHIAADRGWLEVLRVLLDVPGSVDKQDDNGDSPLHLSSLRGHSECVIALVSAGASLSLLNKSGRTPLEEAQRSQKMSIVNYLTRQGLGRRAVNRTLSDHYGFNVMLKSKTKREFFKEKSKSCDCHTDDEREVSFTQSLQLPTHKDLDVPKTIVADTYIRPSELHRTSSSASSLYHKPIRQYTRKARPQSYLAVGNGWGHPLTQQTKHHVAVETSDFYPLPQKERECNQHEPMPLPQLTKKVTTLSDCLWTVRGSLSQLATTGNSIGQHDHETGNGGGHRHHLLAASSDLLVQLASSFNLTSRAVKSICSTGPLSPVDLGSQGSVKLTKGWDYFVLQEDPIRIVQSDVSQSVYLHIQIKPECSLSIPGQKAVLKIVAGQQVQSQHMDTVVDHHGSGPSRLLASSEHPHIGHIYTGYRGNLEGFSQYIDHLGVSSLIHQDRASFYLVQDHTSTLSSFVEDRRQVYSDPPYGMNETTVVEMMLQLFLACSFLERNNCTGFEITPEDVCINEGFVFLNLQEALQAGEDHQELVSNLDMQTGYHGNHLYATIAHLFLHLLVAHPNKDLFPTPGFYSERFWSLIKLLLKGNSLMTSSLAVHLCYWSFHPNLSQKLKTLEECRQWLFTERLTLFMTSTSSPVEGRACRHGSPVPLQSLLHYEYLVFADPLLMWQALDILQSL